MGFTQNTLGKSRASQSGKHGKHGKHGGNSRAPRRPRVLDEDTGMADASAAGPGKGSKARKGRAKGDKSHRDRQVLLRTDGEKPQPGRSSRGPTFRGPGGAVVTRGTGAARIFDSELKDAQGEASGTHITKLRQFLLSRWNESASLLDLEGMVNDSFFKEAKMIPPGTKNANRNAAPALWKLCSEMFPTLSSLSLASNHLNTLNHLSPSVLSTYLPNLRALSLSNNLLTRVSLLNSLSSRVIVSPDKKGLDNLQELVLTGNPVVVDNTNGQELVTELLRRFPNLQMLDMNPIDPSMIATARATIGSSAPEKSRPGRKDKKTSRRPEQPIDKVAFPLAIKHPGFVDSDQVRELVGQFLTKFLSLYDFDRGKLHDVYSFTPNSTFTMCANSAIPERSRISRSHKVSPRQHELTWTPYFPTSHNIQRINKGKGRNRVFEGAKAIIEQLKQMPGTQHPLSDPSKFVFDAWTQPGILPQEGEALFVVAHGEFSESPSQGIRSFDRTFVLAPAPPGSTAASAGWPCVIVSDELSIRGYSSPIAWNPEATSTSTSGSTSGVSGTQDGNAGASVQEGMIAELRVQTRLNEHFARQCLDESGWELSRALANFQAVQASIPPEAFM